MNVSFRKICTVSVVHANRPFRGRAVLSPDNVRDNEIRLFTEAKPVPEIFFSLNDDIIPEQ